MNYTIFNTVTGRIEKTVNCQQETVTMQFDDATHSHIEGTFQDDKFYIVDGAPVEFPAKPSPSHTFNWTTKVWEDPRTLQDHRDLRNAYVNAERLRANQDHFTFMGKQIAADPLSRGDIDAINGEIANTGAFPGGWPGAWKCMDNTWLPVATVAEWKSLYTAMVNQGTANFAHAQALKGQITAATTQADIESVVW